MRVSQTDEWLKTYIFKNIMSKCTFCIFTSSDPPYNSHLIISEFFVFAKCCGINVYFKRDFGSVVHLNLSD